MAMRLKWPPQALFRHDYTTTTEYRLNGRAQAVFPTNTICVCTQMLAHFHAAGWDQLICVQATYSGVCSVWFKRVLEYFPRI